MNKAAILCERDNAMLREFSKRVVARAAGLAVPAFRLPFIGAYLDANVMKEVEKDRLIILRASEAFAAGKRARDMDQEGLFEETKVVDRTFIRNLRVPSLAVRVRYEDFAGIRKKRIGLLVDEVHSVLGNWRDNATLEDTLRAACPPEQFRDALTEILHLYNLETRVLSKSVRFFPPFHGIMTAFAETLFRSMEAVTGELVDDCAKKIYGGASAHATA